MIRYLDMRAKKYEQQTRQQQLRLQRQLLLQQQKMLPLRVAVLVPIVLCPRWQRVIAKFVAY